MKVGEHIVNMRIPLQTSVSTIREIPRLRYTRTDVCSSSGTGMYIIEDGREKGLRAAGKAFCKLSGILLGILLGPHENPFFFIDTVFPLLLRMQSPFGQQTGEWEMHPNRPLHTATCPD